MSLVQEALSSQRSVWREIVLMLSGGDWRQTLPPTPPTRILLFGVGSSYFSAQLAAYSIRREFQILNQQTLIPVIACSSVDVGVEVIPQQGDWAFALSHRGKTSATLKALENCAESGAFTVLVSARGAPDCPLARLILPTSELEKCEPHTVGMTSAICAVTTLLCPSLGKSWDGISVHSDPDLSSLRKSVGDSPDLILGEWEGEWIAREAALKLTEMAQHRACFYSTEEFFHGPRVLSESRAQKQKDHIWYIAHPEDQRSSEVNAQQKIKIPSGLSLSWVSALVESQWMTLALALNLGVNPDGVN